jgi:hypothetical protein
MQWLFLLSAVSALSTPYGVWRKRNHLLPVEEERKHRHSMSLCQAKKMEKAHYDAEVGGSFLQRGLLRRQPKETPKPLPYDGYFNFGCFLDQSPKDARLDYKEEMKRTFAEAKPVDAAVCFEFCRDRPEYKFFGLALGRDCYCAKFTHMAPSGSEQCTRQCEGNGNQMCGGDYKASVYEMHRCSDTIEEAEDTLREVGEFREYGAALLTNASALLSGMDNTADAVDVTEVRHEIFNNSRQLNRFIRDLQDLDKECDTLAETCRELIQKTDPANVEDLRALEESQRALAKTCAAAPGNPADGTGFQVAVHGLFTFMSSHDVEDALAAAGASLDAVRADGMSGKHPSSLNRMTDEAIAEIGCDDNPADGCDDFDLVYWPQGPTVHWFSDFYVPAEHESPMSADEWKMTFIWMCKDLCDHYEGCVAADIYGSTEDGAEQFSANCALKSSVERVLMSKGGASYGYSMDLGLIVEGYFQIVKDELKYIIEE